ncbi:MAG: hypothetical protein CFE43_17900 [Burkholderiales bacterium PBB3]|nr:MAG: hypothetical protein CFE43_17900 [Burkholderiales bacterium PBB3]
MADATSSPHSQASSFLTDLVWMAFWTLVLGSLLAAPHWLWVIDHWNDSTTPVPVGSVQRIHFIGDWGINTQIDTEDRSFVVHDMTRLQKGSRIEQRKTRDSLQLCAVDVARTVLHCEDLMRQ